MAVLHSAPKIYSKAGIRDAIVAALGSMVISSKEEFGEIVITVKRENDPKSIEETSGQSRISTDDGNSRRRLSRTLRAF